MSGPFCNDCSWPDRCGFKGRCMNIRAASEPEVIQQVCVWQGQAIVLGIPAHYADLPEDHPAQHNCDAMGCGQCHVLARVPVDGDGPRPLNIYWKPEGGLAVNVSSSPTKEST